MGIFQGANLRLIEVNVNFFTGFPGLWFGLQTTVNLGEDLQK